MRARTRIAAVAAATGLCLAVAAPAQAGPGNADGACNWGQATAEAIAAGFDQGGHASSFAGTKRSGLANVVHQGNLGATCLLVAP